MKFCRSCKKAWDGKDVIEPHSEIFWRNFKTAELTFCGVCLKQMAVDFDLQMEPPKRVLRLEARKK